MTRHLYSSNDHSFIVGHPSKCCHFGQGNLTTKQSLTGRSWIKRSSMVMSPMAIASVVVVGVFSHPSLHSQIFTMCLPGSSLSICPQEEPIYHTTIVHFQDWRKYGGRWRGRWRMGKKRPPKQNPYLWHNLKKEQIANGCQLQRSTNCALFYVPSKWQSVLSHFMRGNWALYSWYNLLTVRESQVSKRCQM
jgi:hypothetical protein